MTVTHMLPELPETTPTDAFVESNQIPTLAPGERDETVGYAHRVFSDDCVTLSPGAVLHREPNADTESDDWYDGETWWYIVAVEYDRFILFDLERGIFRTWHNDKVENDIEHLGYIYDVYNQ